MTIVSARMFVWACTLFAGYPLLLKNWRCSAEESKIEVTDNELRNQSNSRKSSADYDVAVAWIHVSTIEFEKDDGHNYHAEYAATASSLRGRNYGIPGTDDCRQGFWV
ncbi:ubiquitin-activating enzyme E1 1 isoform X3 [Physcomitrium patens]|uniref:Ubiquitin-activating enzyme SCCH domain-containing protein n=1 Tax=Physcomitrium patens TaxID=3218 RepID=A0A2K1KW03_PHYPA|nr:ubiquitin-activating enzyme E1 1-like isoform X3 [Physcomitrium patens]PNR57949.1 hypothetical protein PHYPA_004943 [Physcomitrium patens]|eukprot:XP_024370557.1 ubiquitin-activating enzyme E1 1-like isoform X3 [Physcomitrella patens]